MHHQRFDSQLSFLIEADKMKNVLRQTLLADGSRQETDAEHSWHLALTAMVEYRKLWEEFDAMETPDAKYAAAMDRLQPLINNLLTQGHTWRLGHVTAGQVYQRMAPIQEAAPALWPFVEQSIQDSVQKGWLTE